MFVTGTPRARRAAFSRAEGGVLCAVYGQAVVKRAARSRATTGGMAQIGITATRFAPHTLLRAARLLFTLPYRYAFPATPSFTHPGPRHALSFGVAKSRIDVAYAIAGLCVSLVVCVFKGVAYNLPAAFTGVTITLQHSLKTIIYLPACYNVALYLAM